MINGSLKDIFIDAVVSYNSTTGNTSTISVSKDNAVNIATGNCSMLSSSRARRLLATYIEEYAHAPGGGRRLAASASSFTKVNMGINIYTPPSDSPASSSQVLSIQSSLSPLLSANGSNVSVGGAGILSSVFGAFLASAANVSGVPLSSVSVRAA